MAANAYWLTQLNDADINATVASMAAKNLSVIRTWAFNDVTTIPDNGTWFQVCGILLVSSIQHFELFTAT